MLEQSKTVSDRIANIFLEKKAQDIKVIDISEMTVIADAFVIASGRTAVQVKALCDEVQEKMDAAGYHCKHIEGMSGARWIIMDYGDVIVHIFSQQDRQFYNIERLWDSGNNIINIVDEL